MTRARDIADIISGIDINGTLTSDGLTVDGQADIQSGAALGSGLNVNRSGHPSYGVITGGVTDIYHAMKPNGGSWQTYMKVGATTGDISFYEDTGTTPKFFWDASAESLGIGTSSPSSYWANADDLVVATSGNTGISVVSGTTSLGYLIFADSTAGGDNTRGGLGYDHSTNDMLFRVNNDTKMRIDSSGNVGIGTSSPSDKLHVQSSGDTKLKVETTGTTAASGHSGLALNTGNGGYLLQNLTTADSTHGVLRIYDTANATERLRIDSSGNLLVGKTATSGATDGAELRSTGLLVAVTTDDHAGYFNRKGSDGLLVVFSRQAALVGSISVTASATSYNTSSDYRLKTDAQPMTGASARVQALNPVNFEWIADGTRVDGFLAHEAQAIVPEAVTGTKDAVDADGNPEYQGIDQSKLVPLLTAALQEALTKIDALETRITALEG